jgi:hypothetical protein
MSYFSDEKVVQNQYSYYFCIYLLNKRIKNQNIMAKDLKRFVWRDSEGILKETRIIVDTHTGVNYLFVHEGYAGGLTPLLDENGKPIVTRVIVED